MTALTEAELSRISGLLCQVGHAPAGPLSASLVSGGRSNLTYLLTDGQRRWALRRPPHGAVIESAHDMAREYRVVAALQGTRVPVADAVAFDDGRVLGAPCAVFGFVDGQTVRSRDQLAGWSQSDHRACALALIDALAELHALAPEAVGLAGHGRAQGYAGRQLRRWGRQWEQIGGVDPAADRLRECLTRLLPAQEWTGIVHGDYRVDNVILSRSDPGQVCAIVDWELSTLGDPTADVALMCAYRHPALDGVLGIAAAWASPSFPAADELWDLYQERSRRRLDDARFHLGLAYYKVAMIAAGIGYRHRLGVTTGDGYDAVAATVPVLLEAGLAEVGRG